MGLKFYAAAAGQTNKHGSDTHTHTQSFHNDFIKFFSSCSFAIFVFPNVLLMLLLLLVKLRRWG